MTSIDFSTIRALTFDCYGTLIDWETGLLGMLRPWATREGMAAEDAALLAAFSCLEPAVQTAMPNAVYPDILRDVMRRIATEFGVRASDDDADALAKSVGDWPPFSDTPAALARLKQRFKLVIASNVDRASFARTNQLLGVTFDGIVTAQDAGSYKPNPAHFLRAFELLKRNAGIEKNQIVHVAESLFHDHVPAKSLGMQTVWIHRPGRSRATRTVEAPVTPDLTCSTLGEFAEIALA